MWNDDPPHGRAVAKGLEPRSAARRKVSTKLLEILHFFLVFNVQPQLGNTATCDSCDSFRHFSVLRPAQVDFFLNKHQNSLNLAVTLSCAAARGQSPLAAVRPVRQGTTRPGVLHALLAKIVTEILLLQCAFRQKPSTIS